MGRANLHALSSQNIIALCDVDWGFVDTRFADIPNQITQAQQRMQDAAATPEQKSRAADQLENWQQLQPQLPKAKRYTDYREMLEKQKNIDAVVVATPDHMHAHIALAAMDLGKHVYVQKPLAWSVDECRRLARKATASKLQTQMGNQGHSSDDARAGQRVHPVRRHRHGHRSARLDQSPAGLLAAGRSAPCATVGAPIICPGTWMA